MSTLRVNTLQNTSTTDGGISINNSGHVTVDGVAMPSAGPLSNRNLIINGAMQVAQRGTSSTATGYGTVDRWKDASSGGSITQSQQALTTGDPYNEGFRNFYRLANTTGTTGAGDTREISTNLEAQDIANSGWQYTSSTSYLTLSFWVRASVTQTYYGTFRTNDSAVYDYGFSFALTADTWTKVTKTIPGNSNLVFNNDNGQGLKLALVPFYGTNYTDSGYTLDAWAATSAGSQLPDFTTTWANTTGATFDVTGVQLEVGSVATPFEHRSYGDELARCERYYQVIKGGAGAFTSNAAFIAMNFSPMRATPTFTADGVLRFTDVIQADYTQSSAQLVVGNATDRNGVTDAQNLSTTSGRVAIFIPNNGNYINASAEL
jgi:hypothetical protein